VFLVVACLQFSGNLEILELAAYDLCLRMAPMLKAENSKITIIEISEKDIQTIGHWPLTDGILAKAIDTLLGNNPRAIGVDIYRDIPVPPGTDELNRIFVNHQQIIGIMTVGDKGVPPLSVIKGTEQEGFGDIVVDRGGIVRRALLFLDDGQNSFISFALRLASLYLTPEGITLQPDPANPQYLRLKDTTIRPFEENDGGYVKADARGYQFLLDYKDMGIPFQTYSFSDLLSGNVPPEAVTNRIILVGVGAQSVKDGFYTPLSRGFDEDRQILPGVVLHGHIVNQLLRFAIDGVPQIATVTDEQKIIWLLAWSLLGGLVGFCTHSARRSAATMTGGLIILFATAFAAFLANWWIPLVPPALSFFNSAVVVTAYTTGQGKKDRAFLMQIFSKHVSKEVAEMLWQQREQFLDNGRPRSQKMIATILFSDLKGFTTMSEKLDPQDLIDWLNIYMESMAGLIMSHGGVVDNFVGDGIKADFGVPLPSKDDAEVCRHAMDAVSCALAMEKAMQRLNAQRSEGHPAMGVRVGIYTGPVVAGLLGSSERLKYTTIGDTVNIASRLESYNKEIGKDDPCRILIGETTLRCLNDQYTTEKIGAVSLKGKDESIIIHRVLGDRPHLGAVTKQPLLS